MTSLELLRQIEKLEAILQQNEELNEWLGAASKGLNLSFLSDLLESPSSEEAWIRINRVKSSIEGLIRELRTRRPGKTLVSLDQWIKEFANAPGMFPDASGEVLDVIGSRIQQTYDAYDTFISSYSVRDVIEFSNSARILIITLHTFRKYTYLIKHSLVVSVNIEEGNSKMSLVLSAHNPYRETIAKLTALQTLYDELCRLLNISTSQYPLQIIKLETGSLWAIIFGESSVVKLITAFIESGVAYLHRNFTTEGKVDAIPKNADVIIALLNLSERLQSSGIDTSVLKENIQQSSVILGKNLNQLLLGEPVVEVNGHVHSVGEEWEAKFLREPKFLFLESGGTTDSKTADASSDNLQADRDENA